MTLPTRSPKYVKRGPYFFNDSDQGVIESEETVSKDESKTSRNNENATVGRKRGCERNNRNNACKRNLELVMKSRLEYPNRSTYSCRPGKSSQNQLYVKYHNVDKTLNPPKNRDMTILQKQSIGSYVRNVIWKKKKKERKKKKEKWYEQVSDSSSETMKLNYCGIRTSNVTKSLKLEDWTLWL